MSENCIFCKIIAGQIPCKKVWENEHVLAMYDINPKSPVHIIILPKVHVVTMDELTIPEACSSMFLATKELRAMFAQAANGYNILCNNGPASGQSVPHLHWHFVAGKNIYASGDVNVGL